MTYIVDETVDPTNMGTYNYASNDTSKFSYFFNHAIRDVIPYYLYGNTREDSKGAFKWLLN